MIKGFKEFILRGNVIDLAVAVVIGAAFGAVVTAVVDAIVTPLINIFYVPNESGDSGPTIKGIYGQDVVFPLPALLTAVIGFFAIAIVVYFALVYPMNRLKERQAARAGVVETAAPGPTQEELLIQIRDLLEKQTGSSVSTTPPAP